MTRRSRRRGVWRRAAGLSVILLGSPIARTSAAIPARPVPPVPPSVIAAHLSPWGQRVGSCIAAAASAYHIPPVVLVILLHVEGGQLGAVHRNANGSVDIGPMQINQIWLPTLARHWHASVHATYRAIEDNFCANVAGGSWILHRAIGEAHGHLWGGVAYYHSHTPDFETDYLRAVLHEVRHLQAEMRTQGHAPS